MANTIIELNDTPSSYSLSANKFLRVNSDGNAVQFWDIKLDYLEDVEASNAYAPSVGQSLVYTADGKWRPSTLDIYSAGNGLNKSALTLNVTAGAGGGLVSNTSGVFISDIANVSGTYGNATHVPAVTVNSKGQVTSVTPTLITASQATTITNSFVGNVVGTSGQISVTGGTGNNSNATLNLVATGVTAATYGNATTVPQITVDTYGRIQNVDLITVSGGGGGAGNVNTAFKHIAVSGQTNISADAAEDTLTLVGAGGISLTTNAGTDTLTITGNSSAIVGASGINALSDVDTTGVTNGQALVYNSSTSKFEVGTPVTTLANSGVTAGTYGSSTNSARIVVNEKGIITGVSEQAIPQGDITEVIAGAGLNGGGTTGSVTLNIENTGVTAGTYGNASVYPAITVNSRGQITGVSNIVVSGGGGGGSDQNLTWNAGSSQLTISSGNTVDLSALSQTLSISGNVITISGSSDTVDLTSALGNVSGGGGSYGNSDVQAYLDAQSYSNVDVDAQNLSITGNVISLTNQSGNVDLTPVLANVTSDYGDSNVASYLSTNGYATQSTIVAAITDSAPGTLDTLNELAAALGDDPNFATTTANSIALKANISSLATVATSGLFNDLTSRPTIALSGSDLTYDGTTLDLSGVGATGPQGPTGADGVNVTNASLSTNDLIITLSNASTINAGNVRGPVGPQGTAGTNGTNGTDGVSITNTALVGSNLVVTLSNTSTIDAGNVRGPVGPTGPAGADGAVDQTLSVSGNVITISGNNDTVDLTTMLAPYSKTDTDAQDLSISGNVISLTGQSGNVDLTSLLVANIYTNSDVDTHLNTSGASSGQVLTWNGSDYSWTAKTTDTDTDAQALSLSGNVISLTGQSGNVDLTSLLAGAGGGGGATTLDDLTDVSASSPSSGQVLKWNGSAWAPAADLNSGGGGGGATIQRFKLNYNSSGQLDSTSNLTSLVNSVTIDSASGGDVTVNFDSSITMPPASVMMYGYDYTNNKYSMVPAETTMALREIAGGGSSGSPTLFDGGSTIALKLRLRETETGASRTFGSVTHAWIQFVIYD
jgi:hypothetical protein